MLKVQVHVVYFSFSVHWGRELGNHGSFIPRAFLLFLPYIIVLCHCPQYLEASAISNTVTPTGLRLKLLWSCLQDFFQVNDFCLQWGAAPIIVRSSSLKKHRKSSSKAKSFPMMPSAQSVAHFHSSWAMACDRTESRNKHLSPQVFQHPAQISITPHETLEAVLGSICSHME